MSFRLFQLAGLFAATVAFAVPPLRAAEPQAVADEAATVVLDHGLTSAIRAQELAEIRLRRFVNVEFPLAIRRLDSAIRLAAAELEACERQIRDLGPSSRFRYSSAFSNTLEQAELRRLALELKLADLRQERFLLERHRRDQQRLLEIEVEAASARLSELGVQGW